MTHLLLTAQRNKARQSTTISYVLLGIGAFLLLGEVIMLFSPGEEIDSAPIGFRFVVTSLFIIAGTLVNRNAASTKKRMERFERYITLVTHHGETSLNCIVSATGFSYETIEDDLQKMISSGYFLGAYIDKGQRKIVLPEKADDSSKNKLQAITCEGCGANNSVPEGEVATCKYCRLSLR